MPVVPASAASPHQRARLSLPQRFAPVRFYFRQTDPRAPRTHRLLRTNRGFRDTSCAFLPPILKQILGIKKADLDRPVRLYFGKYVNMVMNLLTD